MPFIPSGFAQVSHLFHLPAGDQDAVITYGVGLFDLDVDLDALAESLNALWDSNWSTTLSNVWQLTQTLVRANVGGADLKVGASSSPAQTGGDSAQPCPPQVAVLIQKRTGFAGRHNRGRMYFPPIVGEGQVDSIGNINPTVLAARQAIADNWYDDIKVPGSVTSVELLHENPALTPTEVLSFRVDGKVATQRRRLR